MLLHFFIIEQSMIILTCCTVYMLLLRFTHASPLFYYIYLQIETVGMMSTVQHRKPPEKNGTEGKACNFQHLFKMQMMKRERKAVPFNTQTKQGNANKDKMKERSNKIVKLLLNFPINQPSLRQSLDSVKNTHVPSSNTKNRAFPAEKSMRTSKHLLEGVSTRPQRTISQSEIRACDGVWRIKQMKKAFDKEKLCLLQRYKQKMQCRQMSSVSSNLIGTSVSHLSKKPVKYSFSLSRVKQPQKKTKGSIRYRDIPISQFIYEHAITPPDHSIYRGIQKRLQELCRRRNTRPLDSIQL